MVKSIEDNQLDEYKSNPGLAQRWLKEISLVEESNDQQLFERHADRIMKKYKNYEMISNYTPNQMPRVLFNILWSNIQVLEPALYSRMPKVVGERVFKDADPIGRFAAEIAERATQFNILTQQDRFNYNITACVQDRLLSGRGQGWLVYRTEWEEAKDELGEPLVDEETGEVIRQPKPNTEIVEFQHLNYMDYLESKARTQYEIRWRSRAMYFTKEEATKEFGEEIARKLDYNTNPLKKKRRGEEEEDFLQQAKVYLIYDLTSKDVLYVSRGFEDGPLKRLENPFRLKDFWCCPIPLLATTTTDSTYPTADYLIYEGLAEELDYTARRLIAMTECIRLVGLVASNLSKDIKKMLLLKDGELSPIAAWASFAEKGGLRGAVDWLPFDQAVNAIPVLQQRFLDLKSQIDEITSMPDIVQGSSDPNDPVYTQQQKQHWTIIKLVKKQQEVQRFCREIISKMAEIIFEPGFFSDETIYLMAGVGQMTPEKQAMFPEALQLLRDDRLRTFRIDIETDSTIAIDENDAASRWSQYLAGIKDIIGTVETVSQYSPELMQPIVESALAAVRVLRTGRSVEGSWEKALDEMETNKKAALENPAPPPPDPVMMQVQNEAQRIQMQAQIDGQKLQLQSQNEQMKAQIEYQKLQLEQQKEMFNENYKTQELNMEAQKAQSELGIESQKLQIEASKVMTRAQIDQMAQELDKFKEDFSQYVQKQTLELETYKTILSEREKILEEARLQKEQQLEMERLLHEKLSLLKDAEITASNNGGSKQNIPPITVNIGSGKKVHKLTRTLDGFIGESSELEEEQKGE